MSTSDIQYIHNPQNVYYGGYNPSAQAALIENGSSPYHPVVRELADWISSSAQRISDFEAAIATSTSHGIAEMDTISSVPDYLTFLSQVLTWTPTENVDSTEIIRRFSKVYFVLDQPSVSHYQTRVAPEASSEAISWLSLWIARFGDAFGHFMDTPESISPATLATFVDSPKFRFSDYLEPEGGWKTFNEFFARQVKPGLRPLAAPTDAASIASPADCTLIETKAVCERGTVMAKTIEWRIEELLHGSPYAKRFTNLTHAWLGTCDYHRLGSPVEGTVLEARRVVGTRFAQIEVGTITEDGDDGQGKTDKKVLRKRAVFDQPNEWGYQFNQTRVLIVLETVMGLVALVPVSMAVVCSVMLSLKPGDRLEKGQEVGYFQFGGSDIIMLFERPVAMNLTQGHHILRGEEIARFLD